MSGQLTCRFLQIDAIMTARHMAYCITMKDAQRCYKGEKRADGQRVIKSLLAKGEHRLCFAFEGIR